MIQGAAPSLHDHVGVQDFTPRPGPRASLRTVSGTFRCRATSTSTGCPPGRAVPLLDRPSRTRCRRRSPATSSEAPFQCNIPRAALGTPSRIALYGHGLLGSHTQIDEDNIQDMSAEHDFTFCATDWAGMAADDMPNAIEVLQDFSKFPSLADRLQQGIVNTLYLGRLLAHPQGFAANPAFRGRRAPLLDTSNLYFDSNSQGAILGGARHRGGAGLEPRGARRGDDELRDAAAALGRLRHLQRRSSRPPTRTTDQRIDPVGGADAVGPRRDRRLGART